MAIFENYQPEESILNSNLEKYPWGCKKTFSACAYSLCTLTNMWRGFTNVLLPWKQKYGYYNFQPRGK